MSYELRDMNLKYIHKYKYIYIFIYIYEKFIFINHYYLLIKNIIIFYIFLNILFNPFVVEGLEMNYFRTAAV